jgi:hypothetical protein
MKTLFDHRIIELPEPNVWDVIEFRWWGTWIEDWEYRLNQPSHQPFVDFGCYSNFTEIWGAEVCFWITGSYLDENEDYGLQDYLWQEGVLPGWIADWDIYNIRCSGFHKLRGCPSEGRCVGRLFSPVSEQESKLMNRD